VLLFATTAAAVPDEMRDEMIWNTCCRLDNNSFGFVTGK
jgi:hypothetical protein